MPKSSRHSALWEYLEASGVLINGTDAEIKAVKQEYRKKYLLEFKRKQRARKPEYTINFSKHTGEYAKLERAAKEHNLPVTGFIHKAVFAYLDRTYIVPNREQVARLEQLLAECLNEIRFIIYEKEKRFWERERKLEDIDKRIGKLEVQISDVFRHPPLHQPNDTQNKIP